MNNAGIGLQGTSWDSLDAWHKVFDVNVFGCALPACAARADPDRKRPSSVVNVQQTFVPSMLHQENPAVIINTGSKQGITNPP